MATETDDHGLQRVVVKGPQVRRMEEVERARPSRPSLDCQSPDPQSTQSSSATVYLHGAHITSYTPPDGGDDVLFVSSAAVFAPPKAIRGGVPLCWPQFGNFGPMTTQHGFARNVAFGVESVEDDGASVTLVYNHAGDSDDPFPHPATLRVRVSVVDGGVLTQRLSVTNGGESELQFTTALHTYFGVGDVSSTARVSGLQGTSYLDSLDGRIKKVDDDEAIAFTAEVDRIYVGVPRRLTIEDGRRTIALTTTPTLPDAVVWNPWIDKAAATADLQDDDYTRFVCVEAALAASEPARVAPGGVWVAEQRVEVVA